MHMQYPTCAHDARSTTRMTTTTTRMCQTMICPAARSQATRSTLRPSCPAVPAAHVYERCMHLCT